MPSWLDTIKNKWAQLDLSSNFIIELVCYLIGGFVVGFILKHFGRYIFFIILGTIGLLWLSDLTGIVSINYSFLKELMGTSANSTVKDIFSLLSQSINAHISQSIAAVVGLFLAWELA